MAFTSPFMQLADFDFHLPQDRIALRPASPRDSARLLLRELERLPELEGRPRRQAGTAWATRRRAA